MAYAMLAFLTYEPELSKIIQLLRSLIDIHIAQDGKPGSSNQYVARDAFNFSLNYYAGDYHAISSFIVFPAAVPTWATNTRDCIMATSVP